MASIKQTCFCEVVQHMRGTSTPVVGNAGQSVLNWFPWARMTRSMTTSPPSAFCRVLDLWAAAASSCVLVCCRRARLRPRRRRAARARRRRPRRKRPGAALRDCHYVRHHRALRVISQIPKSAFVYLGPALVRLYKSNHITRSSASARCVVFRQWFLINVR